MLKFVRTCSVHLVYAVYYALIWWRLGLVLEWFPENNKTAVIVSGALCSVVFISLLLLLTKLTTGERCAALFEQTWCHVPMLTFIAFSIGPYGMLLHHQYKYVNPVMNGTVLRANQTNGIVIQHSCFDLQIPQFDFITLQVVMPLLVLTYLLYPYPDRKFKKGEIFAVAIKFLNAFDIMGLVADIGCVQTYSIGWVTVFYIALGVSTVLLAFPDGLEEDDIDDQQKKRRVISSIMTLIFTDFLFFAIRLRVIVKTNSLQNGFDFLLKNFLSVLIRPFLICMELIHD